jgi:hypothetical protein
MAKKTKVVLKNETVRVFGNNKAMTRDEVIAAMDAELAKLSGEERLTAKFEIADCGIYDEEYAFALNFVRQETDEEREKRETAEKELAKRQEERDRATFARLSKKYG